jgi:glycosyltransferase involved in cell wall biosynthesis
MKVLHVTPYFAPAFRQGEMAESVYRLCLNVARAGCDVKVLTTNADSGGAVLPISTRREYVIAAGLAARYCRRHLRSTLSTQLARRLALQIRGADVVHLTSVYSFPVMPTLMACRLFGKPLVWSPRGALLRWRGSRYTSVQWLWRAACKIMKPGSIRLHFTSADERDQSISRIRGIACVVIPDGVPIPPKIQPKERQSALRLGYCGYLRRKSGIENLLAACRILLDSNVAVQLTIAANGDERANSKLKRAIAQAGLEKLVTLLGHLSANGRNRMFADIDLLVAPSFSENFCMPVAEALAAAVPVVASKGTPWQRVEEIGCGVWVDNEPSALAAAVMRMREQPLSEMGRRGREWIAAEFSSDRTARAMCNCYSQLIYGRPVFSTDSGIAAENIRA